MSIVLPPNSSGSTLDTVTTVSGTKERQCVQRPVGGQFAIYHAPTSATQATITQASAGSGIRNVVTSISYSLATGSSAQTIININLRDGATGSGTILWSKSIILNTNSVWTETVALPDIQGSTNTATTLEFSGAGVTGSYESVCLCGFTTA